MKQSYKYVFWKLFDIKKLRLNISDVSADCSSESSLQQLPQLGRHLHHRVQLGREPGNLERVFSIQ